ncbi:TIGR03668 family PPOX class F420-dependent oxidoreductase [Saccharopolyspora sp. CA-218241]|uniref:TIGR03668 family PPOX class F420-dependent oxidoreductase n=1 Tax=Saccharopolyspora sp. CA-218241 TaxID=3240027 RepID=UPI003D995363
MRISQAQARDRFGAARVARLATADAAGSPHLVPVVFAVLGDEVGIAVDHKPKRSTALKRLRNVEENPAVSLLADHYEDDWSRLWWVRADGIGAVRAAADRPDLIDALVAKYPQYRQRRPDSGLLVVDVRTWRGWAAE